MANPKHMALVKQNVMVWNQWRRENPDIVPDFSKGDLRDADLDAKILISANFELANLTGINLSDENLNNADFNYANLSNAKLKNARLVDATFYGANLNKADLSDSALAGATIISANLDGTCFTRTKISHTSFDDVDFSKAIDLETIIHYGPSTVGIDTIYKSKGKIPKIFLRGCGVPALFIDYMDSLVSTGIEFSSCFISYSSKDHEFAERLYKDLQSAGVRVWFAPEDMKIGDPIRSKIDQTIHNMDKLLLILSESSVTSTWVKHEVDIALRREIKENRQILFPIRLDDAIDKSTADWAGTVLDRHIGDFCSFKDDAVYKKSLDRVIRDLKTSKPAPKR